MFEFNELEKEISRFLCKGKGIKIPLIKNAKEKEDFETVMYYYFTKKIYEFITMKEQQCKN